MDQGGDVDLRELKEKNSLQTEQETTAEMLKSILQQSSVLIEVCFAWVP